jgi:hypothetical protein
VSPKADKVREFWSPNIIGGKYKPKREVPRITSEGSFEFEQQAHGTHAAPRMHWRRGHFRMHAYGGRALLDRSRGDVTYAHPRLLPGGRLLYTLQSVQSEDIYARFAQ